MMRYGNKLKNRKIYKRFLGLLLSAALVLGDSSLTFVRAGEGQPVTVSGGDAVTQAGMTEESTGTVSGGNAPTASEGNAPTTSEGNAPAASEGNTPAVPEEDAPAVSGGDAPSVSDGDGEAVSSGDASSGSREPEAFYEEPEPEDYGTLAAYDEYSRTYHVEGNRYVTVIGNDGATYMDWDGSLKTVDNTLVENPVAAYSLWGNGDENKSYVNAAGGYTVCLPEKLSVPEAGSPETGEGITITSGEYLLTLYPAEGCFTESLVKDNAIRYSNVFPGIDYQYTVLGNSVKEDIILLRQGEKNSFSYLLDTCGLAAHLAGNTLYLYEEGTDPVKDAIFVLEAPEMTDAAGELSFGVKMELAEAEGGCRITVTADQEWLAAPERVYPVRIDPTAIQVTGSAIRLSCAEEGSPNTVIGDNQYPYVGYDDGVTSGNYAGFGSRHLNCRTYFAIDYDFSSLLAEAEIVSAALEVTQKTRWSKGTSEFGLYGVGQVWETGSLTWNSQLSYDHYFLDSRTAGTVRGEALQFDVTEEVSAWINGTAQNHGFVMKAQVEAPSREAADAGVKMQCEVFYNNASASYAPRLVISWTGELLDLEALSLDDTTIDIYPVAARNGDRTTDTLGVCAHGLAKAGSTVTYRLVNGTTGQTEAETSLIYPDSSLYADAFPSALAYNRRLSNWQSEVFAGLVPGQLYYVTAQASKDGEQGKEAVSDTFLIHEEGALDLIPRIALHYGVDVNTIMADMQMQDALTREGNRLFIRNPQNTAPYTAGELSDFYKAMLDGLLLGRAENCVFGFEPINLNTGNFYMEQTDASIPDIGGDFAFTRQYNSKGAGYAGSLGYGWSTPFDERLGELADGSVLWLSGTGSILAFTPSGAGYTAPAGMDVSLQTENDAYVITDKGTGEKHIFNAYGMLTAIEDIHGSRTTLAYDMEYRLAAITSPSGKTYGVTLDGENRITGITLPDGHTVNYTYDNAGNLSRVTDEAGDTITFAYNKDHQMTAWYDENGHRVVYNTYDGEGRVTKQEDAEGGIITLSYGEGCTTAADANGNVTVYHYDGQYRTTKTEYADGTTESRTYSEAGYLSAITDRQGVTTGYTYDEDGRLTAETRQDGTVRTYAYTAAGRLERIVDFDGAVTAYAYDEKNRISAVTDAEGGTVRYAYDNENRLVSVTDAEGGVTTYAYEGACVKSMTDAEGGVWHYTYDAMNRQLTATNPLGETEKKTYDEKGRCVAETDGAGNTTRYVFDGAGNVTAITDREGQTSTFVYDKKNQMLSGTDPLGGTLAYTYDANGNVLTETDALGAMTVNTVDAMNRLVSVTDAEGRTTAYTFDAADRIIAITDRRGYSGLAKYDPITGSLLTETDERGYVTSYETDSCGRTTRIIHADGSSVSYAYDRLGRIIAVTDQLGTITHLSYDANGNLTAIRDGEDRCWHYTYDALNRLVRTEDPLGGCVSYAYDGAGRLAARTDELGHTTRYAYDGAGNLVSVTDAGDADGCGGTTRYSYDKEGRLTGVTTPEGRQTTYAVDATGQPVSMTDASGAVTEYSYDGLGRLIQVKDGAGIVSSYTYDSLGRLTSVTDAMGNTHAYRLDEEGNLLTDTYPNGETENYRYLPTGELARYTDRYGVVTNYAVDAMGRVIKAEDTAGNEMAYEYDAAGSLEKQTDVLGRSTLYAYDALGRLISVTEADGAMTRCAYDAKDRLISVTDAAGNATTYTYDAADNLTGREAPGEAGTTYAYDALDRLTGTTDPEGAVTRYTYDRDGNLTGITDGNGICTAYAYDSLNRLSTYTDGNGGETLYAYDIRNNLTAITTPEGITERYGYDGAGNLLSVTGSAGETWHYEYDALYRLVRQTSPLGAVESYAYDRHDVVTSVTDALGAVTAYEVDANGRVTAQTAPNGGIYTYTYDAVHRLTGITTPSGYEKTLTYSVGDDIIKEEDSLGRTTRYAYDVLHNLTEVTDAEGGVTTYAYDVRNNRTAMTNALGNTYTFAYDRADRLLGVTDPEEKTASVIYDMAGHIESLTTPGNRTTSYTYDGNYNTVSVTDPKGYVYGYRYDADDRLTGTTDPLGQTTAYTYDGADRLLSYTDKLGLTESYTYDAHGNVLTHTAADGRVTGYVYDLKDRLTQVTSPAAAGGTPAALARYTYDEMGNLTAATDYAGRTMRYTYDLSGNLTSITDPAGRREQMTYDAAGRLTSYTSNGGNTITYDYDRLNALVEKSYTDPAGETAGEAAAYAYDALGERVAMYDGTGDTEYTYDSLGRITSVTTYRTPGGEDSGLSEAGFGFSHEEGRGDTVSYTYDEADNLSAITYPDGTSVLYEYDLNDNLVRVTDREGLDTVYVYDELNRIIQIHRPNGISTCNTYDAEDRITELTNTCDDCGWVVSTYRYTYDERGFIVSETATESLAGYAYDDKHAGKHEDGKHDDLYPHGNKHNGKHDKDATFAYQIVETVRTFTYDDAGKLLSCTETEDNYGTYIYTYEYDMTGNRTAIIKKDSKGTVVESRRYVYNESSQLVRAELYNGKKTTSVSYAYDADGSLISETGRNGTEKVELTYTYTVENRLEAVHDGKELLMAAAYDGDGNRVFQLNYNLHTDEDWKGNSGNGNGSNKDNSGSGNNGNGNGNGNGKNKNNGNNGNGNATNAEENNSQNQCGILFPIAEETSDTEEYLISLIKTTGKEKNYELIEYINDVNREYTEVLVEQNMNGRLDTAYVYGASIGTGSDRLSLDRFDGSTGYYLYDPRGSVSGITNEEGQVYQSYRYSASGEITFGAPQYENEYTYNGESYNPNIESQYLRARYYDVVAAAFLTEDFYPQDMWRLWNIAEPLTLNRYSYCVGNPVNYVDKSGHWLYEEEIREIQRQYRSMNANEKRIKNTPGVRQIETFLSALHELNMPNASVDFVVHFDYRNMSGYLRAVEQAARERNAGYSCEIFKVTPQQLIDFGWKAYEGSEQGFVVKLNRLFNKYGLTEDASIAMFMATIAHESSYGVNKIEGMRNGMETLTPGNWEEYKAEAYGANKRMDFEDRGTGYGQMSYQDLQKLFLESIGQYGRYEEQKEGGKDMVHFIADNYALESAVWIWTHTEAKKTGEGSLNDYVVNNLSRGLPEDSSVDSEKWEKGIFLITQYYYNGFLSGQGSADLTSLRKGTDYEIKNGELYINGNIHRLPNGWEDRSGKYEDAIRIFGSGVNQTN